MHIKDAARKANVFPVRALLYPRIMVLYSDYVISCMSIYLAISHGKVKF